MMDVAQVLAVLESN